jgi:2-amino-4-hydroxy-6-hydroxymethyldihydropteridine diphosphokinase
VTALTAVLSLGSNLGDREQTIRDAVADLAALGGVEIVAVSGLVETPALKPHGVDVDAPAYLNAVAIVSTILEPEALLDATGEIELRHGRVRDERWGDRTLDIDLVTVGDIRQSTDRLTLPHPRAVEREFVLVPWLDIDPDAELPGIGRISALSAATTNVRRYPAEALS